MNIGDLINNLSINHCVAVVVEENEFWWSIENYKIGVARFIAADRWRQKAARKIKREMKFR